MKFAKYLLGAALIVITSATFAAPLTLVLGNHVDGALYDGATNPYGVRIDDTGQTFTVGDNLPASYTSGPVLLTFDPTDLAADAIISGTVIDNATGTSWNLMYVLSDLAAAPNGGFSAQAGTGTLTEQGGAGMISLSAASNGDYVFILDNDGHRLDTDSGWVARGWFDGEGSNDLLLVASPVPVPAAIWMFGAALVGLFGMRRNQR